MRLKQFLYLQTVAEYKSMAKASEKLYISHQALSYALRKLEEEYHVQLLERTPFGASLTKDGEEFLAITQQILELHNQLKEKFAKKDTDNVKGELKIVASYMHVNIFLPNVIYWLNVHYPNLELTVKKRDRYGIMEDVEKKEAAIGMITVTSIDDVPQIAFLEDTIFIPIFQHEFRLVMSKKNPLGRKKSGSLKKLQDQKFVLVDEEVGEHKEGSSIYGLLKAYEIKDINITSPILNRILLEEGEAITLMEADKAVMTVSANPELVSVSLRENISGKTGFLIHKDNAENEEIKIFLDAAAQFSSENINVIPSYKSIKKIEV